MKRWDRNPHTGGISSIDLVSLRVDRAPLVDDLVRQANTAIALAAALRELVEAYDELPGSVRCQRATDDAQKALTDAGVP